MGGHDDRVSSGEAIRRARLAAGISSQAELGRRVGAKQQSVGRWENGEPVAMENLVALVRELPMLDPLAVIYDLWPEIADADPVPAELRDLIAQATTRQRDDLTTYAHTLIHPDTLAYAADTDTDPTRTGRPGHPRRPQPPAQDPDDHT